ncbi:uncharacterized protein K02A2.6-like [Eupeodes corollae]|uniref:uncharacterized protein K02A2.6-like n=1 Tax=Eupeodes corollae TaxID=290404 RepID=UPI002492F3FA|nr:uncharacterized protein K02A2.6-like [Eupeodes corollae]
MGANRRHGSRSNQSNQQQKQTEFAHSINEIEDSQSPRVVIPFALQPKVLTLLHQGHWGVTRMKQMTRRYCWWANVDDIIESTVAKCNDCQSNANRSPKEYSSWTTSENFVIQMSSTIHPLRSIFALEGLSKVIVSDNSTQFTPKEFQQFCQDHSIRHITSAPFHTECNERMVRVFKTAFPKVMTGDRTGDDTLATFLSTFQTTPDEIGISPVEKLHDCPSNFTLCYDSWTKKIY